MRRFGIAGLRLRERQVTTVPEPSATPGPDLLRRDFTANAPNTTHVGDITYLPVGYDEFRYLVTVIDCFSRRPVRWSMGTVGTNADNTLAESFNAALNRKTLKGTSRFDGARPCHLAIFRRATRHHTRRRHSANGQQAPVAYEQQPAPVTPTA
ncbi:hypothetical protein SNOUR_10365 [Streptomyces noursei ATCC 11455]|nr:hypothetical protein SNOUR_10365 [Streptomyces noursei ATCC 11455]